MSGHRLPESVMTLVKYNLRGNKSSPGCAGNAKIWHSSVYSKPSIFLILT